MISAPISLGGLGLPSLEVEQLVEAINLITTLFGSKTPSYPLLCDLLELMQLEIGLGYPVVEANFDLYGHLITPC